jgi:hypothetical protein
MRPDPPRPYPQTIAAEVGNTLARGLFVLFFSAATAVATSHLVSSFMR